MRLSVVNMNSPSSIALDSEDAANSFARQLRHDRFAQVADSWSGTRLESLYDQWERFFAAPAKTAFEHKAGSLDGFFPMRSERAKGATAADPKEFFHYYEQGICPPALRGETQALFEHLKEIAARLLSLLDRAFSTDAPTHLSMPLAGMIQDSSSVVLRIAHYPLAVSETKELAATHEDINLITLLPPATAGGLEVRASDGRWMPVSPQNGTLLILAGDMLAISTRNYFQASTHRVVQPRRLGTTARRLSLNFFVNPAPAIKLNEHQTAAEVLAQRLRELGYT